MWLSNTLTGKEKKAMFVLQCFFNLVVRCGLVLNNSSDLAHNRPELRYAFNVILLTQLFKKWIQS